MTDSDRPLYEDLLKQRNQLERLVREMAKQMSPQSQEIWLRDLDEIIVEERRRGGLT